MAEVEIRKDPAIEDIARKNKPLFDFGSVPKKKGMLLLGAVLAITLASYLPVFRAGFVGWDDNVYVTDNPEIENLSFSSAAKILTSVHKNLYKPLTILSFAVEYKYFKLNPAVYHTTNLLFHLANCALVFYLILALGGGFYAALITAILFGIHPMHVESVAWIAERKDQLYTFFMLGSMILYLSYSRSENRTVYYASLLIYILSLMSKPQALALPFLLLLCDYFTKRKINTLCVAEKVPFLVLSILFAYAARHALAGRCPIVNAGYVTWDYVSVSAYACLLYLGKAVLPVGLCAFYPFPELSGGNLPLKYSSAPLILLALAAGVFIFRRRSKTMVFGTLFFALTIFPALPLRNSFMAIAFDHFTYVPYIGLFFIIGRLGEHIWLHHRLARSFAVYAGVAVVIILSVMTSARCMVWHDGVSLWSDFLSKAQYGLAYRYRGDNYLAKREFNKALSDYTSAIALTPDDIAAYDSRGEVYEALGENEKAIADYEKAIALSPETQWNGRWLIKVRDIKAGIAFKNIKKL
jgi:hypothetical protein